MMNLLHQLLKRGMQYLVDWLKCLVNDTCKTAGRRDDISIIYASGVRCLDQQFRNVAPYPALTTFQSFSTVKQWTDEDQKAVARQLVLVVAPLLTKSHPATVLYTRAMCDFWMITQYHSHNDDTLQYLEHALYCIDKLKWTFSRYQTNKRDLTENGHFNNSKLHAITHYLEFIRRHGTLDSVETSHSEVAHAYTMKEPFKQTNKREKYEDQIARHYSRQLRMSSLANQTYHNLTGPQHTLAVEEELEAKVTVAAWPATMVELEWFKHLRCDRKLPSPTRLMTRELVNILGYDGEDFIMALVVFILETRKWNSTDAANGIGIATKVDLS